MTLKIAPFMKTLRSLILLLSVCATLVSAHATTVIAPTFDELLKEAELIFQGTVSNVRSDWTGEGDQRRIMTYVTFQVEDAIKGKPGATYTISMLGGTVGDRTMEVTDSPKFKVGDKDVVFVQNNGSQFIPLVGIMHGRFRIQRDQAGKEGVFTNSGAPLTDLAQLGRDEHAATSGNAIPLAQLKLQAREKLERIGTKLPQ